MRNNESGNILLYIFIAVALLGALSYTVARSGQVNMQAIGDEKAGVESIDLIAYGNAMVNAVSRMRLSGVKEYQLSFQRDSDDSDYENNRCTKSNCMVFDKSGGGMNYQAPKPDWLSRRFEDDDYFGEYYIHAQTNVEEVGSRADELIMFLPYMKKAICVAVNKRLGIEPEDDEAPAQSDDVYTIGEAFAGEFGDSDDLVISGNATAGSDDEILHGEPAGCVRIAGTDNYVFYQVLLSR